MHSGVDEVASWFTNAIGGGDPTDPYPRLAQLRAETPIRPGMPYIPGTPDASLSEGAYTAYSFEAVSAVMADDETFSSSLFTEMIGATIGHTIVGMDEPQHHTYRAILQQAFSRAAMRRWETDLVRPLVTSMLDDLPSGRHADLVRHLCLPFPLRTIATLLGLPRADWDEFQRLAIKLVAITIDFEGALDASRALRDYFSGVLAERRRAPEDDMISILAHAEVDGQRLLDEEIFSFLRLLLPAGAETTFRALSSLLFALLTHPDQLDAVRRDRNLLAPAIEETVRWETPVTFLPRKAVRATELCGVEIPAGSNLFCHLGAANRDPRRWEDPDRFDVFRERRLHIGFGYGIHTCLGMHLSRMEVAAATNLLFDRLPDLRLDPKAPEPFIGGTVLRAPPRLEVVW
jgi:cytochrome P450